MPIYGVWTQVMMNPLSTKKNGVDPMGVRDNFA
jgi:hypothetical protein